MAALIALGLLAALSLSLSKLPWTLKIPGAVLAAAQGLRLARREWRRPAQVLTWAGGPSPARLDGAAAGQELCEVTVEQRASIAVLAGRDATGRRQRLVWWPDTLPPSSRRQLRLAAGVGRHHDRPLPPVAA